MTTIKNESLKDQVYQIVRTRILDQTYEQGKKINIQNLAQEMHISHTPIREALSMLENDGLVVVPPNSGPKVVKINNKQFREIFDTALAMFLGCYELCIQKNNIAFLIGCLRQDIENQKKIINTSTKYEFALATIAFDSSMVAACKNSYLSSIYDGIFAQLVLVSVYDHTHFRTDKEKNIKEHEVILNSIISGNHDAVRKHYIEHYARHINCQ